MFVADGIGTSGLGAPAAAIGSVDAPNRTKLANATVLAPARRRILRFTGTANSNWLRC
jgi:hypothetical protein